MNIMKNKSQNHHQEAKSHLYNLVYPPSVTNAWCLFCNKVSFSCALYFPTYCDNFLYFSLEKDQRRPRSPDLTFLLCSVKSRFRSSRRLSVLLMSTRMVLLLPMTWKLPLSTLAVPSQMLRLTTWLVRLLAQSTSPRWSHSSLRRWLEVN